MTTEVNWILEQLGGAVDSIASNYTDRNGNQVTLKRVNRDDSSVYEGSESLDLNEPMHKRKDDLETGVFVGATLADRATVPAGTEYDHDIESVVSLRLEGMTSQGGLHGHVDPDGTNGVPWELAVRQIRMALLGSRSYPDASVPNTSYHTLLVTNEDPQSAEYRDFYRWEADVVFQGYEDLP
ncbi:hypothetical protein HYG81_15160 [Natrinema zhouii]|uniref:Uncharacterized protein n=1 Tax=Natrinema zhouii TaxID=1710539 RepID=A0A7D6CMY7_9EURY|nr:hypothetical protein [Natrinema zhouii]QLK25412.1 hypothetical protein HYG81_15160 [Natrinema zhouii]